MSEKLHIEFADAGVNVYLPDGRSFGLTAEQASQLYMALTDRLWAERLRELKEEGVVLEDEEVVTEGK